MQIGATVFKETSQFYTECRCTYVIAPSYAVTCVVCVMSRLAKWPYNITFFKCIKKLLLRCLIFTSLNYDKYLQYDVPKVMKYSLLNVNILVSILPVALTMELSSIRALKV